MLRTGTILAILIAGNTALAQPRITSAVGARGTASERSSTTLRATLARIVGRAPNANAEANVDASIVSLTVEQRRHSIVTSASVRLAISDANGKLLCVISGSAKVESSGRDRARTPAQLHDDALVAALEGVAPKLTAALAPTIPVASHLAPHTGPWLAFARPPRR